jgi:peptide/nickel transport system permease protein
MGVKSYIAKRVVFVFFALWLVASFNYFFFFYMVGDPALLLARRMGLSQNSPEYLLIKEKWGTDQPPLQQYVRYVFNLFRGDFGISFRSFKPVTEELLERIPNTLALMGTALIISTLLKLYIGLKIAYRRGKKVDMLVVATSLALGTMPVFWLGMIMLMIFSFGLHIVPAYGTISDPPNNPKTLLAFVVDYTWHMITPLVTLLIIMTGSGLLGMRNLVLNVLSEDYITVARAKGAPERSILYKHVLKNVSIPIVTGIPGLVTAALGGAPTTETVFAWYGMGQYMAKSLTELDYPALQGTFFMMALLTVTGNFIADLIYGLIDPRIKVGGKV